MPSRLLLGQIMDIKEFEKQVKPAGKRSQLEQFKSEIFELRAKGYANGQIRDFLNSNGLTVSTEAVRKFILSRKDDADLNENQGKPEPGHAAEKTPAQVPAPKDEASGGHKNEAQKSPSQALPRAKKRDIDLSDYSDPD
jgi:hypothetical protein